MTVPSSSPTSTGRPPRVGPNVRTNAAQLALPDGLFGRSETTIAGAAGGSQLVAGFNDAQGFCGPPFGASCTPPPNPGLSGFSYSTDSGLSWTDTGPPPALGTDIFTRGDPWLDRGGADGSTYYYANLAVSYPAGQDRGVSVHRGHFTSTGSFVWDDAHSFTHPNAGDLYDKDALAAAKDGSGAVYVSLTNFIELCGRPAFGFGRIEVWRSHDSGASWQGPALVSQDETTDTNPSSPTCGSSGTFQQGSTPAIASNGTVYVVWNDGPTLASSGYDANSRVMISHSSDGGATWSAPVAIASGYSTFGDPPVGYNRGSLLVQPRIAIAGSGPYKGRIYVTYSFATAAVPYAPNSQQTTSIVSYLTYSDNGGASWATPRELGAGMLTPSTKRIWPVVTVEPSGVVDVVYQESLEQQASDGSTCFLPFLDSGGTRSGLDHSFVNTYWTQSTDGGANFATPIALSTATSDWCTARTDLAPNFGDYVGAAPGANRVFGLWGDGRNLVPDSFFATGFGQSR